MIVYFFALIIRQNKIVYLVIMELFNLLTVFLCWPRCFLCITLKQSADNIESEVSAVVQQYFTDELTLGLFYDCDENVLSIKNHLPVNIYNNMSSNHCYNIVKQSDGFIFLTSNINHDNTNFHNFVQCVRNSTINYKLKKFLIIDVMNINNIPYNKVRYLQFFHFLWMSFEMVHIIILPVVQHIPGFEVRHILAYNPFLSEKYGSGQLLVFDVRDEFVPSLQKRFTNMHGYSLNVCMFPFGFNVQQDLINRSDSIQGGNDLMLKRTIESQFNVTLVPHRPPDNQLHGYMIEGKPTGSLADVMNNLVEYTVNNEGYMWHNTTKIQRLQPDQFDSIIVVVRKKPPIETWNIFLLAFEYQVWLGILITTIVVCALYVLFEKVHSIINSDTTRKVNLSTVVFVPLKSLSSLAVLDVPRQTSGRVLMASCLLFSIIIVNLFSGQIYTLINLKPRPAQVNTLQKLLGYKIITQHKLLAKMFDNVGNSSLGELKHTINYKKNTQHFMNDLGEREAYLDSRMYMLINVFNGSIPDDFHVLKEPVFRYYLGHMTPAGSIYYDQFNSIVLKVFQFGLFDKWIQESFSYSRRQNFYSNYQQRDKIASSSHNNVLKYEDLKLPFYIFYAGILVSVICFLVEIIVHKHMSVPTSIANHKTQN